MANWSKWLWGGLGWAMFGPIGGIMGLAMGSLSENNNGFRNNYRGYNQNSTNYAGDFGVAMLILFASVMKADGELKKSELEYVKQFFIQQFNINYAQDRIRLFRQILKQDYQIKEICEQIKKYMDHPSRLQMIHVLFGLSKSDGHMHIKEIEIIYNMSIYLGISQKDFEAIKAMFIQDASASYNILEVSHKSTNDEIKKAYRKMASKFHPDKVHHLGEEFQKMAEEKFKSVNEAYSIIKKERGFS